MSDNEYTTKLLNLVESGTLESMDVLRVLVDWIGEEDITSLCLTTSKLSPAFDDEDNPSLTHCDCCGYRHDVCECEMDISWNEKEQKYDMKLVDKTI